MVLLTVVVIVFCELAPKIYAAVHPGGRGAARSAYIYRVLVLVARPVALAHQHASPTASCACSASARRASTQPGAERRGAAHRGRRGRRR